jgi:hypothetical protein
LRAPEAAVKIAGPGACRSASTAWTSAPVFRGLHAGAGLPRCALRLASLEPGLRVAARAAVRPNRSEPRRRSGLSHSAHMSFPRSRMSTVNNMTSASPQGHQRAAFHQGGVDYCDKSVLRNHDGESLSVLSECQTSENSNGKPRPRSISLLSTNRIRITARHYLQLVAHGTHCQRDQHQRGHHHGLVVPRRAPIHLPVFGKD